MYNDNSATRIISIKLARRRRMLIAWSVWFVAAVFTLFQFFLQLSSGVMIDALMKSFSLAAFGVGILAGSYYYIYTALQIPAGLLLDRYGPRIILSIGAFVVCIGCFLFATAKTMSFALLGRVLMGGGSAFAFVGCMNLISIWFPQRKFALMASMVETAGMFAALMGNFWLAYYVQKTGWRDCMLFASIFAGILSLSLFLIVRNTPRRKKSIVVNVAFESLWKGLKSLLRDPIAWMNGIYSGLMFSVVTVFTALWGIPFFQASHHIDLQKASLVVSTLYIGFAIASPIVGWLDGKTNWRRRIMIYNAACASLFLFIVVLDTALSLTTISILLFLTGLCISGEVMAFAIANEMTASGNRATSIGFMNMLCVSFALILQPFVGFLITELKNVPDYFQIAMSVVPILLIFAFAIAFFLPNRKNKSL